MFLVNPCLFRQRPLKLVVGGRSSLAKSTGWQWKIPLKQRRTAQNIKDDRRNSSEPLGLTGDNLLGLAMACSLRDSQQGFRGLQPHLTQRTSYPLPSSGRPFGHREAPLLIKQLPKSNTAALCLQTASVVPVRCLRLSKSSTTTLCLQVLCFVQLSTALPLSKSTRSSLSLQAAIPIFRFALLATFKEYHNRSLFASALLCLA